MDPVWFVSLLPVPSSSQSWQTSLTRKTVIFLLCWWTGLSGQKKFCTIGQYRGQTGTVWEEEEESLSGQQAGRWCSWGSGTAPWKALVFQTGSSGQQGEWQPQLMLLQGGQRQLCSDTASCSMWNGNDKVIIKPLLTAAPTLVLFCFVSSFNFLSQIENRKASCS